MASRIIDISHEITPESVVYPGDEPLEMERVATIGPDCPYNLTKLVWNTHFLTHVDPPRHFVADGPSIDEIPLDRFIGEAVVIEVAGPAITLADLPGEEALRGKRVLFKTDNSERWDPRAFQEDHVFLTEAAAKVLVSAEVALVGIDYIDVEKFSDETFPVHRLLLGVGIPILEGLDLSQAEAGLYILVALPLKIKDGDGSPVRAVLIRPRALYPRQG